MNFPLLVELLYRSCRRLVAAPQSGYTRSTISLARFKRARKQRLVHAIVVLVIDLMQKWLTF